LKSTKPSGVLSIVATPIGNLEDVTLRALRTLREADAILAEDTRRTRALLARHEISARVRSLHAHTSEAELERIAAELENGARLALVTDAGTPLVSDPGARLAELAAARGVRIEPIPGPSAVLAALAAAALPFSGFSFVGFLPRSGRRRREAIDRIARATDAVVLFEAPPRLRATLEELASALGDRPAAVCRELTKLHEEIARGTCAELAAHFDGEVRGEITIVIGATDREIDVEPASLEPRIDELVKSGARATDIAKELAGESGLPRAEIYRMVLERTQKS
jgi:16S rRNA (cytidine1402-2'-O)-methyltransferase